MYNNDLQDFLSDDDDKIVHSEIGNMRGETLVVYDNDISLFSRRGGFLHIRVKSGVDVKLVGFKDDEGESPRVRAYIEEGASLHVMDCIIVSVDCKGLFKTGG